jgi:hypothetical protein
VGGGARVRLVFTAPEAAAADEEEGEGVSPAAEPTAVHGS